MESTVWPVFAHLQSLLIEPEGPATGSEAQQRSSGLLETLNRLATGLGIEHDAGLDWRDGNAYDVLVELLAQRRGVENPDSLVTAVSAGAPEGVGVVSARSGLRPAENAVVHVLWGVAP